MPKKKPVKLKFKKNKVIITEGADTTIGKLMAGCKGKININTPFGKRKVKVVKKFKPVPRKKKKKEKEK